MGKVWALDNKYVKYNFFSRKKNKDGKSIIFFLSVVTVLNNVTYVNAKNVPIFLKKNYTITLLMATNEII